MRVLHVISALGAGGAESLVRDLAFDLTTRGVSVGIAFISTAEESGSSRAYETDFLEKLERQNIPSYRIGHSARRNPLLGAWRLRGIVREFQPDILHVHLATALFYRLLLGKKVQTVYTHHNTRFRFPPKLLRLFDLVVDRYVAISDTNRGILSRFTRKPVVTIYNGTSAASFAVDRLPPSEASWRVISVGRLHEQKDYDTLIEVAALVAPQAADRGRSVVFQIAGDGQALGEYRTKVRKRGLDGIVVFLGARTDVSSLMAQADLMLMTSRYEGLPISLIEALHAGLPIVTTEVGGCGEIVRDGYNGALTKPGDPEGIASKIVEILSDQSAMKIYSENARAAARRFSIEACGEEHDGLYRSILKARGH